MLIDILIKNTQQQNKKKISKQTSQSKRNIFPVVQSLLTFQKFKTSYLD